MHICIYMCIHISVCEEFTRLARDWRRENKYKQYPRGDWGDQWQVSIQLSKHYHTIIIIKINLQEYTKHLSSTILTEMSYQKKTGVSPLSISIQVHV